MVDWLKAQGGTCLGDYGGTLRTRHDQLHNDWCSDNFLDKIRSDKPDASGNVEWGYDSTAMAFWRSEPLRASRRAREQRTASGSTILPSLRSADDSQVPYLSQREYFAHLVKMGMVVSCVGDAMQSTYRLRRAVRRREVGATRRGRWWARWRRVRLRARYR